MTTNALLVVVVATALIFDFVNGFHDAANSIATVVATRVLQPWQAVIWAAFWNFVAFLVLPLKVANEIAKIIDSNTVSIGVVFAGLLGAIVWNVVTAFLGLPSSSSHALIGGMIGAGIAKSGGHVVDLTLVEKTAVFIVFSPLLGLLLAFSLVVLVMWLVHRSRKKRMVNRTFRSLQLVSAAAFSLGHGANDAQKTMGIITALLVGAHKLDPSVLKDPESLPLWIVLSCQSCDRTRHDVRRLAYRTHDGQQADPVAADGRCVRRERRRGGTLLHLVQGHPGQHDAHDHGRDRRCGLRQPHVGGSMERRPAGGLGMGVHDSGCRCRGDACVLDPGVGELMDRRAVFFLCCAIVCALMTGVTPASLRWVGEVMAIAYAVLAAASWLDYFSRRRSNR